MSAGDLIDHCSLTSEGTVEMLLLIIGLATLGLAAHRWGVDSTDGPDSAEWVRRRAWNTARGGTEVE